MIRYTVITLLLFVFSTEIIEAQYNKDDCFIEKNEKIFVQLAKDVLVSGESIVYNAFLVNACSLRPNKTQSKVAYFELCDENNKRVLFWRNNIESGVSSGSVNIPDTFKGGVYCLKAYTNWMRNFNRDFYFKAKIAITNFRDKKLLIDKKSEHPLNELSYYPVGGNIIYGFDSQVAVKYTLEGGKFSAELKNQNGELIDSKPINNCGTTVLHFVPQENLSYFIEVRDSISVRKRLAIENISNNGQSFFCSIKRNFLQISSKAKYAPSKEHLVIRVRGKIILDTLLTAKQLENFNMPISALPIGILHIVLLDDKNELVAEQLVYNKNQNPLSLTLTNLPDTLKQGKQYSFNLKSNQASENNNYFVSMASYSEISYLNTKRDMGIYFNCFSELMGGNEYSVDDSANINEILLATPIKDYYWADVTKKNFSCNYLQEDKAFILQGSITDRVSGLPLKNTIITLSFPDSIAQLNYTISDSAGKFSFLLRKMYDNKIIILQLPYTNPDQTNVKWEFDNKNGISANPEFSGDSAKQNFMYIENYRNIQLVKTIFEQNSQDTEKNTDNPIFQAFYLGKNPKVNPSEFSDLVDFQEIADNILPGINFKNKNNNFSIYMVDPEHQSYFQQQATVFLNGVLFNNLNYISTLGTKEIKEIELIRSQVLFGNLSFYGILLITTKEGKVPASELNDLSIILKNEVISNSVSLAKNSNRPDFRTHLLFENKPQYNSEYQFLCPELSGKYLINIKGFDARGNAISETFERFIK